MQKYKKILLVLLLLSLLSFAASLYIVYATKLVDDFTLTFGIGEPLMYFSLSLVLTSAILLFLPEAAFNVWKKFALWYLPVSIILIAKTDAVSPGMISFDRESVARFLSLGFLIVSIIIGIYKKVKANPYAAS